MKTGIEIIADERARQIEKEGWNAEHDDEHKYGELADAAASYAMTDYMRRVIPKSPQDTSGKIPVTWPFGFEWWKETPDDRIKELAKAGALIAAEIDRLLRLKELEDNLEEE